MNLIQEEANQLFEFTRNLRRDLHKYPELGFEEFRTSKIIAEELSRLGLEIQTGVGRTGVSAVIDGNKPGRTVLIRFDMDALPILEESGAEYSSQTPGKMHACGHDAHVAIGLSVTQLLVKHQAELHGRVKIIFQPAEEGQGGAEEMIKDGILEDPKPDLAYSLHVWNDKPVGWIGLTPGLIMAASDIFSVKVIGKGGHGALPNNAIDPIAATAQIITSLQTIVSRNIPPLQSAVVSVTRIAGGETYNVIPQSIEFWGTIRTFEEKTRQQVHERFVQIVSGVAQAMNCQVEIQIKRLTPAVNNALNVTAELNKLFHQLDPGMELDTSYKTMGSEDMAYILERIPGCYFLVGSGNPDAETNYSHHHPKFDIDERVLPRAVALMTSATLNALNQ
jgi:amidohydrolase